MASETRLSRAQRVILFSGLTLAVLALALAFVLPGRSTAPTAVTTPGAGAPAAATLAVAPDLDFYFDHAATAYQDGNLEAARQDYDFILQQDPENAAAHLYRGNIYDDLGQPLQALADYDEALRLDPGLVDAYLNRGLLQMKQREYEAALADYERAAELDPTNATAYYGQAFAYQEMDNCDGALRNYSLALDNDAGYVDAYYGRGRIYFYCFQDYDRAIQDYNAAIGRRPDFATAYFARGAAYHLKADTAAALADYEHYLAIGADPQLRAQAEAAIALLTGE